TTFFRDVFWYIQSCNITVHPRGVQTKLAIRSEKTRIDVFPHAIGEPIGSFRRFEDQPLTLREPLLPLVTALLVTFWIPFTKLVIEFRPQYMVVAILCMLPKNVCSLDKNLRERAQ